VSNGYDDTHVSPRTLAGATILQIVPAMREEPVARTAVNVAYALLQSGARALIAADDGPWWGAQGIRRRMGPAGERDGQSIQAQAHAHVLEHLITSERVDIVHAQSIGGAWCANMAARRSRSGSSPRFPTCGGVGIARLLAGQLARGDRVITPSNFAAEPVMARYDLPRERLTVIPRSIDTQAFDPRP